MPFALNGQDISEVIDVSDLESLIIKGISTSISHAKTLYQPTRQRLQDPQ